MTLKYSTRPATDTEQFRLLSAYQVAQNSQDPRTHVGCVIYQGNKPVSSGANCYVNGLNGDITHYTAPYKYYWMVHAEAEAVLHMLRCREWLRGTPEPQYVLYAPWACCDQCAKIIVASGIKTVIAHHQMMQKTPARWKESVSVGLDILRMGGVTYEAVSCEGLGVENMFNGEIWRP